MRGHLSQTAHDSCSRKPGTHVFRKAQPLMSSLKILCKSICPMVYRRRRQPYVLQGDGGPSLALPPVAMKQKLAQEPLVRERLKGPCERLTHGPCNL